jgi:hypothetical protein
MFLYYFLGAHAVPVPTQDGATTCTEINAMSILNGTAQFGPYDKVVSVVLEILEGCFTIEASPNNIEDHKAIALETTTKILAITTSNNVENSNKALLSTLFPAKNAYHIHKGQLISKCPFGVFKSTKKPMQLIFVRIFTLASKNRSN